MPAVPPPICPRCGQPAAQVITALGKRRSRCCDFWSTGEKPLQDEAGHRAAWELKSARREAHAHFDPLWQSGLLEREDAYQRLAQELGIAREACHMSRMSTEIAVRVPAAVRTIRLALKEGHS